MAECRAREEKLAKEQALAKQKEALKGKMGSVGKKAVAPAPLKSLTVETDNKAPAEGGKSDKLLDTTPDKADEFQPSEDFKDEDDDFDRDDDEPPMTKE